MKKRSFLIVYLFVIQAFINGVKGSLHCEYLNSVKYHRPHSVSITEFGAIGDGITLNTKAFQNALFYLNSFSDKGGAKLFVPAGQWLTGSFDLISHLTLWLDNGATILGSMNSENWPVVEPLPSYGRGRELPGKRHRSLIYGQNLTDVVITGENGTIDGQGSVWWDWFRNGELNYTRPHLVELMNSTGLIISNLTFIDSPFWNIHPVYCRDVVVKNVTILAPLDSPNTDGVDPDSSTNVCIEDCYIVTGDDLISIKSGWDEYGISYARPSSNIRISRLTGQTTSSSGIAIGSEMSGGISEIYIKDLYFFNSNTGIRIKTSPGRGGYVRNVHISNAKFENVSKGIRFTGRYGEHPDENYDPKALPEINKITIENIVGDEIGIGGLFEGIQGDEFENICLVNVSFSLKKKKKKKLAWKCAYVSGYSELVLPEMSCDSMKGKVFPEHRLDCFGLMENFNLEGRLRNGLRKEEEDATTPWLVSWF